MPLFGILFGSLAGGGGHAWRLSFGVSECNTIKIVGKGRWDVIHFLDEIHEYIFEPKLQNAQIGRAHV